MDNLIKLSDIFVKEWENNKIDYKNELLNIEKEQGYVVFDINPFTISYSKNKFIFYDINNLENIIKTYD